MKDSTLGFDSPPKSKEEDYFDRWLLATRVYELASDLPKTWAVRIGVCGEWGAGKTSMLGFVGDLAQENGDIVIWFNPWAITNAEQLWFRFMESFLQVLDERNIRVYVFSESGTFRPSS